MVVLPAPSSPRINMRSSFSPHSLANRDENSEPGDGENINNMNKYMGIAEKWVTTGIVHDSSGSGARNGINDELRRLTWSMKREELILANILKTWACMASEPEPRWISNLLAWVRHQSYPLNISGNCQPFSKIFVQFNISKQKALLLGAALLEQRVGEGLRELESSCSSKRNDVTKGAWGKPAPARLMHATHIPYILHADHRGLTWSTIIVISKLLRRIDVVV
jgi:hypothetical protein